MSAVTPHDALSVTAGCLELLRGLAGRERRRVLSALTAVVDLTEEPRFIVGVDPASGPDHTVVSVLRRPETASDTGLHSPHFACAPEDVPEPASSPRIERWKKAANEQKERPAKRAPKALKEAIVVYLRSMLPSAVPAKMICADIDSCKTSAIRALRELVREGRVETIGETSQRRYRLATSIGPKIPRRTKSQIVERLLIQIPKLLEQGPMKARQIGNSAKSPVPQVILALNYLRKDGTVIGEGATSNRVFRLSHATSPVQCQDSAGSQS